MTRKEKSIKRMTIDFSGEEIMTLLALRSVKEFITGKAVSLTEVLRDAIGEKYAREKQAYRHVVAREGTSDQEERDSVIEGIRRESEEYDKKEQKE